MLGPHSPKVHLLSELLIVSPELMELLTELLQFDANSREFRAKLEELQTNLNQARDAGLPPYDLRKRQEVTSISFKFTHLFCLLTR